MEIQLRTTTQSAWANTYERLADRIGRGIRYGEIPDAPGIRGVVEHLHTFSNEIAALEQLEQQLSDLQAELEAVPHGDRDDNHRALVRRVGEIEDGVRDSRSRYIELLLDLKRTLDDMEDA
ncbi:hypothetical protein BTZ20_5632 [Rhodococcus sp. MTM3W5.2]|nr:hypothetical protein BTZ20_5632 [Rhodococcus sp. MTM3W5.2]